MNKIDKNHDGLVTQNELRNWIRLQHKAINQKHTDKTWSKLNSNSDEHVSFDELIDNTIGAPETCSCLQSIIQLFEMPEFNLILFVC